MRKSDLPFGSEFSPSQIDLKAVLDLAYHHAGNWKAFENAVREKYFDLNETTEYNRRKLANNTKLGMIAYGIIDRNIHFTEFGHELYSLRNDEKALYRALARHILLNLNGAVLVQCVQDIQASGETVDLVKLRARLEERGVHFPRGGKHASIMRLWLEKAGVFSTGWNVNEAALEEILNAPIEELDVLASLTPEQRAYLKTLANLGGPGPYQSNDIEKLATATYGVQFNEKMLPKTVLYPLRDAGFITLERGTAYHGAKPFKVYVTEKLNTEVILPLLEQVEQLADNEVRPLLRKPLGEILAELESDNKHVKGLALEALAFKLMRLIDLRYVYTRLRGNQTGGAEVDVIFEGTRLAFSRWQIQCKNTRSVSLEDVAKEVGLSHLLKSNVIVIVTTGEIGPEARKYANKVMQESNLCIIMMTGSDLQSIEKNPSAIVDVLKREAKHAMHLKALDLGGRMSDNGREKSLPSFS